MPEIRYAQRERLHFATHDESNVIFVRTRRAEVIEAAVQHVLDGRREKRSPSNKRKAGKR